MYDYSDDFYDDDSNSKQEFVVNIDNFIASIEKYKKDYSKDMAMYWRPEYAVLEEKFHEIRDTIEYNWMDAKEKADKLSCFKFENFAQYVFNTDLKNTKHIKGTSVRAKTLRRKRDSKCPNCKIECIITNDVNILKCPVCGHEIVKEKVGIPDNVVNNEKHIRKQLDKLVGLTKIPNNVRKLLPSLTIWLTEWWHIRDWLLYSRRYDDFVNHYSTRTGKHINMDKFETTLARTEDNKMQFCVYEIFVEEFYKLTEISQTTARKSSNVNEPDKVVLELVGAYLKSINKEFFSSFQELPDETTTFDYKGKTYSIGIFFGKLGLIPNYDKHHIKAKIVKKYCKDGKDCLTLPGLVYNYSDIFSLTDNIPRSFNYSENYNKIMNEVFHSRYSVIPPCDINKFVSILLRFNEYYKKNIDKQGKKKNTKTNSPLFVCTIKCIITTFVYFNKYVDILEQTPHRITESVTKNEIDRLWIKFITEDANKDLLELYDKPHEEEEDDELL